MIFLAAYVCVFEAVCVFVRMFIRICVCGGHYMCGACKDFYTGYLTDSQSQTQTRRRLACKLLRMGLRLLPVLYQQ